MDGSVTMETQAKIGCTLGLCWLDNAVDTVSIHADLSEEKNPFLGFSETQVGTHANSSYRERALAERILSTDDLLS